MPQPLPQPNALALAPSPDVAKIHELPKTKENIEKERYLEERREKLKVSSTQGKETQESY